MSGRIQQIDDVILIRELQNGRGDRNATLAFHLHPIGGGRALIAAGADVPCQFDGVAVQKQFFGQRSLARIGM